jgi:thioredoxin-like negative regulator of GroEL
MQAYHQALASDPGLADAHFNLSRLYEQAGDRLAALRHLRSYKQLIEAGA